MTSSHSLQHIYIYVCVCVCLLWLPRNNKALEIFEQIGSTHSAWLVFKQHSLIRQELVENMWSVTVASPVVLPWLTSKRYGICRIYKQIQRDLWNKSNGHLTRAGIDIHKIQVFAGIFWFTKYPWWSSSKCIADIVAYLVIVFNLFHKLHLEVIWRTPYPHAARAGAGKNPWNCWKHWGREAGFAWWWMNMMCTSVFPKSFVTIWESKHPEP